MGFRNITFNADVDDPWVDASEAEYEYGITPVQTLENGQYDAVILALLMSNLRQWVWKKFVLGVKLKPCAV